MLVVLNCARGWKAFDESGEPLGFFESEHAAARAVYEHSDYAGGRLTGGRDPMYDHDVISQAESDEEILTFDVSDEAPDARKQ